MKKTNPVLKQPFLYNLNKLGKNFLMTFELDKNDKWIIKKDCDKCNCINNCKDYDRY